jgi:hypothetical protein
MICMIALEVCFPINALQSFVILPLCIQIRTRLYENLVTEFWKSNK